MTSSSGPARRIGAPDAKNRAVLLDAAEQLLLEEGYAAVTSRRVAETAGLKPQLVHYYFRTMEDLFLAVFRRMAEAGLEALTEALRVASAAVGAVAVQHPAGGHPADDRVHGPGQSPQGATDRDHLLRRTVPRGADTAIAAVLERYGVETSEVPPVVWTVFATSVSQALVVERALGMTTGHAETFAYCEKWIRRLEGEPRTAGHQLRIEHSAPFGP